MCGDLEKSIYWLTLLHFSRAGRGAFGVAGRCYHPAPRGARPAWSRGARTPHRGCALLVQRVAFLQLLVELTPRRILQDQVYPPRIMEIVVQTQDVGVPEKRMEEGSDLSSRPPTFSYF